MIREAIKIMTWSIVKKEELILWNKVWYAKLIPKIAFLILLTIKDSLVIVNNLKISGFSLTNRCIFFSRKRKKMLYISF